MSQFKDSLQLPKTSFPMKADLKNKEPEIISYWNKNQVYEKLQEKNKNEKEFSFLDGPPYANGNLHLGHVLNKVLKDILVKSKAMQDFKTPFTPGWDCHGLPIELKVLSNLKEDISDHKLRTLCEKEARKWVLVQKNEFIRLGILADWENPYLSLNPEFEKKELEVFSDLVKKELVYRGEKPVFWCVKLQTALAAAEVEYKEHQSDSIYVKFEDESEKDLSFVIWTTTPWTLVANEAVCLHPDLNYGIYESTKGKLVLCEKLKRDFEEKTNLKLKLKELKKGKDFENRKLKHPFLNKTSLVILGDHVAYDAGTGLVHTAPSHGLEDYKVGLIYKLPLKTIVSENGTYSLDHKEFKGMHIFKANPFITEKLEKSNHLLFKEKINHSYPYNPRSNTPLIFRATPQWFIRMDDEKYPLRKKALEKIENEIKFTPLWGKQRLKSMIETCPDWCISRQRKWGVPIPVFYCEKCGHSLLDEKIIKEICEKIKDKGVSYYFETDEKELLAKNIKCKKCSHDKFIKNTDILDVWFDSGTAYSLLEKLPCDVYLEGSDQHRGWFQTSLISCLGAFNKIPFKNLITHGFVNDIKGFKMSKSKGNVISPQKIIDENGAELLRLWASYEDYGQDVSVGDEIFKRIKESYRRFRNTFRFLLGSLDDFNSSLKIKEVKKLDLTDQWALDSLYRLNKQVLQAYKDYQFHRVFHLLNEYVTVQLSKVYLDLLKDRLYTFKKDSFQRRSAQSVLDEILDHLNKLMAPILSFLAEEVYSHRKEVLKKSIFLESFPPLNDSFKNEELFLVFKELNLIKKEVYQEIDLLKKKNEIKSSLELVLNLKVKKDFEILKKINLKEFFILSEVNLEKSDKKSFRLLKSKGKKCPRCWIYSENSNEKDLCPKCEEALK